MRDLLYIVHNNLYEPRLFFKKVKEKVILAPVVKSSIHYYVFTLAKVVIKLK